MLRGQLSSIRPSGCPIARVALLPPEVYVLSVLKFTCPTLFQGWQTLVGGLLLHVSWKLGWVEINSSSRSDVLAWLPASVLFVGIIYAGSRALSRLAIPVFLTLHNAAEVIVCGHWMCFRKEFDPDGYFWAVIHLLSVGAYKILQTSLKPSALSVALLAAAAHPTGDLLRALDFPFLYVYRFHGSCCASGLLGFLVTLSAVKLKSLVAPGQCAAWLLLAQVATAGLSVLLFEGVLTRAAVGCGPGSWVPAAAPDAPARPRDV
ncbi:hypothetical protein D623_10003043 [Myotis brandtii]|uniref:Transmembrane protein 241 n=1 Tax=Myotis brandtii TaxID=109478 RepID=S7PY01_MYOBR|nr:hypothetical protein D623_10003043 [Myotis brandtii]